MRVRPRSFATVGAALAAATALSVGGAGSAAAADGRTVTPPPAAANAADRGADWLATRATTGGYLTGPTNQPDVSNTAYAVLAFHAALRQKVAATKATAWLTTHAEPFIKDSSSVDQPGSLALLILAAHADGTDPSGFGTSGDLVTRLLATQRTTGADAGLFGAQDPTYDGAFRQGLALAALAAVGRSGDAQTAAARDWLLAQQCTDGGWMPYRSDLTVACAPNPSLYVDEQTDQAGAALMGLRAVGVDLPSLAHDPRAFLHAQQRPGGGFRYNSTSGADPNSTAYGLHAVIALGDSPTSSTWTVAGKTAFDGLRSFQLSSGAFFYPSGGGTPQPNLLATTQAVPAMAGFTLPVPHTAIPAAAPPPATRPTPTPAPTTPTPVGGTTPTPPRSSATVASGATLPATGGPAPTWLVLTGELLVAAGALLIGAARRTRSAGGG